MHCTGLPPSSLYLCQYDCHMDTLQFCNNAARTAQTLFFSQDKSFIQINIIWNFRKENFATWGAHTLV